MYISRQRYISGKGASMKSLVANLKLELFTPVFMWAGNFSFLPWHQTNYWKYEYIHTRSRASFIPHPSVFSVSVIETQPKTIVVKMVSKVLSKNPHQEVMYAIRIKKSIDYNGIKIYITNQLLVSICTKICTKSRWRV